MRNIVDQADEIIAIAPWSGQTDANDGVDDARFRHRMCQRVIVEQRIT
jgi:hypothetical protein